MKRRAFIQALLIFILLIGSWVLLFLRFNRDQEPAVPAGSATRELPEIAEPAPADRPVPLPAPDTPAPEAAVPDSWSGWTDRLQSAASPAAMRAELEALKSELFTLPRAEAIAFIRAYLESGADLRTGLAFQPGRDQSLIGAASLRALLLDWLHALDPELAAQWAEAELLDEGTGLVPDVYAIHLRNYALGTAAPDAVRIPFLIDRMEAALQHAPWLADPTSAVAEMMDVAVYANATRLVPALSQLMERDDPQMLRRAAALTIERLVDQQPLEALSEILQQPDWPDDMGMARAGYFARLDPEIDGAAALLEDYLASPQIDPAEARFFLLSFPNLNRSFSNNLLSNQNFNTTPGAAEAQLESALRLVRQWQDDPALAGLGDTLDEVEGALVQRLYGPPSP
jgi:hypothetical protein